MSFVHPLLLAGLVLICIPVLIHLIMQQKPKRQPFPAFRFLLQKHRTNQRTLRLRHLLLLSLRIALIALFCLALARPKLFSERLNLSGDRPLAVALVFDTSPSMEYTVAGRTRLDEAKRRALELLDELPPDSRVAVFDSAEPAGEWLPTLDRARETINGLRLRYANRPLPREIEQAHRLLAKLEDEYPTADEMPPRLLYVFSDRARESWDADAARDLRQPAGVNGVFVDVGVEKPADVAVVGLDLPRQGDREVQRQVFGPDDKVTVNATVRAAGTDCNTTLLCQMDDKKEVLQHAVVLKAGESKVFPFELDLRALQLGPGPHRIEVKLASNDAMPYDNARFATFEVRSGRKVLVLADDPWRDTARKVPRPQVALWTIALEAKGDFSPDVRPVADAPELVPNELLTAYKVVCLLHVADPTAERNGELWRKLKDYVALGGGLAVVPGGDETKPNAYNDAAAQEVLPGRLVKLVTAKAAPGVAWGEQTPQHALLAPFRDWAQRTPVDFQKPERLPRALYYWEVAPSEKDTSWLVRYADEEKRPALLERTLGRGRVLLFTTPLDARKDARDRPWNTYWSESSFGLVLTNETVGYLAGDADPVRFNFQTGDTVTLDVPPGQRSPQYTLKRPAAADAVATVPGGNEQQPLQVSQATTPGNFELLDFQGNRAAAFSMNVRPEESVLDRAPAEPIEALMGEGAVLPVGHDTSLRDALQGRWSQPVELLPWLMIFVLLVLAVENLLANRFYGRRAASSPEVEVARPRAAQLEKVS